MTQAISNISNWSSTKVLFTALAVSMAIGVVSGVLTEMYALFGLPIILLGGYMAIVDFKQLYYLLLIFLPLSTEISLPGGFGTDLPSEPLMWILTGIFFLYALRKGKELNTAFLRHPLTLLLFLHIGWIFLTTLHSEQIVLSVKFFLAKIWYVVPFYFLTGYLIKTERQLKTFFYCVFLSILFTVIIILIRHAADGFSFEGVNFVLNPFYRNHVAYASILVLFFPYLWYAPNWVIRYSFKWWWLIACIGLFLVAIYLTYTRAAYVSLLLAIGAYMILKLRLMKVAIVGACLVGVLGVLYVSTNNKYLEFAPDYSKTITHKNFDNLLEATAKGEDISTMERVYRWVAGVQMVQAHPFLGFGPGNFYDHYVPYTVTSFETYVSDNPEQSGVHSYFLMIAVEQGIPGLLFFLALCFYTLLLGERVYHQTSDRAYKRIVLMAFLSIVIIDSVLLINDMIETDKVGSFFFIGMAILVNMDLRNERLVKKL